MDWEYLSIYPFECEGLKKALDKITNDFIDDDGFSNHTVYDLRDACLNLISVIEAEDYDGGE